MSDRIEGLPLPEFIEELIQDSNREVVIFDVENVSNELPQNNKKHAFKNIPE